MPVRFTSKRERVWLTVLLLLVATLTLLDLLEDRLEGVELSHLLSEAGAIILTGGIALYLWRSSLGTLRKEVLSARKSIRALQGEVDRAQADRDRWKREASTFLEGLGIAIDDQFARWDLTPSEREVALLLLKGLSLKEIARCRDTSERTVRQQSGALYAKAGVAGRAQLSAFFLEDLLLPSKELR